MTASVPVVRAALNPWEIVRAALAAYRSQFGRVALTAVALYVPIGFFEAFFVDLGEGYFERHDNVVAGILLAAVLVVTSVSFVGDAFFAGFLDAAVGEEFHGHPHRTIGDILRHLPYRRLVVADVLLGVLTGAASLALLVPGLLFFTFFCLVGPLINIERLPVRAAFARSFHLVRPAVLVVAAVVTLPVVAEHELAHALQIWAEHSYALKAAVDGGLAAVVYSIVGMVEVTLAYELIARDRGR
ncbi:MAG TPA: hypothetical protein VFC99_07445 [Acidimicrobiia bacterium]|nr:hypothetical protein [Acidimicrobiia bacterium]